MINSNFGCKEFLFIIYFTWVFPTVTKAARVSSNSKTLIDNVLTNKIVAVKNNGVILSRISDHFPIFFNQDLTNELSDTHVTYRVRVTNRAC